jgi:phenylacetic acid degradation operon negative regulatory protein
MKKVLKLNEILLLSIGGLLDLFQEIKDPAGLFERYYQNFYGFVPERWKKDNFYSLIYRTLKTKLIEKVEKDGEVYFRLTRSGKNKVTKTFPLVDFQNRRWDKKWRLVIFDIQETSKTARERLRAKLKELGFGLLQKSVWLSPHDILNDFSEFTQEEGFNEEVIFLETADLFIPNTQDFINRVWRVDDFNQGYKEIFNKLIIIETESLRNDNLEKNRNEFYQIYQEFIQLVLADPFLPKEFLPKDWCYFRTLKQIRSLKTFFKNAVFFYGDRM